MHVVVLSQQLDKIRAVAQAWARAFPQRAWWLHCLKPPVEGIPHSEQQVLDMARARLRWGRKQVPQGDFWVALEAGLHPGGPGNSGWMVTWVLIQDRQGRTGWGRGSAFPLPPQWWEAWRRRPQKPLPWKTAVSSGKAANAIDVLSQGKLTRTELYTQAVLLALLPWIRPDLW